MFTKDDRDLGCYARVKHCIDTGDARPIRQTPHHTPLGFQGEEESHLKKMLDLEVVLPSCGEWASRVVFVWELDVLSIGAWTTGN